MPASPFVKFELKIYINKTENEYKRNKSLRNRSKG